MKYDFEHAIAKQVGVEEAILYSNISWWCAKNKADKSTTHFKDGHYWTYSSENAWAELFPFWTAKQVSRLTVNLEKAGLIATSQFSGFDRTKWFRPLAQTVGCIDPNGLMQQPERSDDIKEQIKTSDKNPDIISPEEQAFEDWWKKYPRKIAKPKCKKSFLNLKTADREQCIAGLEVWLAYWEHEKTDEKFIAHPTTFLSQARYAKESLPLIPKKNESTEQTAGKVSTTGSYDVVF